MGPATDTLQGYLRSGKVLQLLGKDEVALSIYKYGIQNVPPDDPHLKVSRTVQWK